MKRLLAKITNRCNFECLHCMSNSSPRATEIPLLKLRELLLQFAGNDYDDVIIVGGEPLLNLSHFQQFIELLDELNISHKEISVITNGTHLLNADVYNYIKKLSFKSTIHIMVSTDVFHKMYKEIDLEVIIDKYKNITEKIDILDESGWEVDGILNLYEQGRAVENADLIKKILKDKFNKQVNITGECVSYKALIRETK